MSFHTRCCPKTQFFSWARYPEFGYSFNTSRHANCCSRTKNPLPNFLWQKGPVFGAQGFGQSFGSFLLLHLIRSCYFIWATTMTYIPFSVQSTWGYGVQIAWPAFQLPQRSVAGLVSSNTEGEGRLNLTFPLSGAYHVTQLNYILRKCKGGNRFTKSQEKMNHFLYMDDIKIFAQNEKELEAFRVYSQDMVIEFGNEKNTLCCWKKKKKQLK